MQKFAKLLCISVLMVSLFLVPISYSFAGITIFVYLDKPHDFVKKTDDVKFKGDIDGLEAGKKYIIRVQVYEDGGMNYSAPLLKAFTVEE